MNTRYYVEGDPCPTIAISADQAATILDVARRHEFNRIKTVKAVLNIRRAGGSVASLKDALDLCDAVLKHYGHHWVGFGAPVEGRSGY